MFTSTSCSLTRRASLAAMIGEAMGDTEPFTL